MNATGYSTWEGTWKAGEGTISTATDTVRDAPYSFASRFEGAPGASPEELLAAAHAGCFNQALANNFGMNDLTATRIETAVTVEMGKDEEGHPAIVGLSVTVEAKVPGASQEIFDHCAERARTRCSIAKALKVEIGLKAKLLA